MRLELQAFYLANEKANTVLLLLACDLDYRQDSRCPQSVVRLELQAFYLASEKANTVLLLLACDLDPEDIDISDNVTVIYEIKSKSTRLGAFC
ncbi:MAG: hypothetical protein II980_07255 [Clostridia bacterium]|nr:hypothetical protein [Clostridia bacterium]